MNKLYCPDCGTNNSFASKKPNFCSCCGYKFASLGSSNIPQKQNNEKETTVSSASAEDWFEFDKSRDTTSFKFTK